MIIEIIAISKLKNPEIKSLCNEYIKRIKGFTPIEIKETKTTPKLNHSKIFLLDEKGQQLTSREFASLIQKTSNEGNSKITFIIGGDSGLPKELYKNNHKLLSLSPMTLQHDLARLIFLEQLYRAFTIINKHPYHRD